MLKTKRTPKICTVCGHKAVGYNFGAITCEPCKAFFRRNAFRDNLKCLFQSNCTINEITRRFCPKCRLDKCFAIGMRRDWMPCEEVYTSQTHSSCVQKNRSYIEVSSTNSEINNQIADNNEFMNAILDNNTENQFNAKELNEQIIDLEGIVINGLQDYTNNEIPFHNSRCMCNESINHTDISTDLNEVSDETYQKAIEFQFSVIPIARPIAEYKCNFNDKEMYLLYELCDAVKDLGVQHGSIVTSELITSAHFQQTVSIRWDNIIKTVTRAIRKLAPFRAMCESDQILLLKSGCLEIAYLCSILRYNFADNSVIFSDDGNRSMLLRLHYLKQYKYNIYQAYIKYLQTMVTIWDSDKHIINLMTSIVLFNPDNSDLQNRDSIKLQQHIYMYLLQRYLLLKYPSECEAKSRFLRLMNITNDLKVIRDAQKSYICDMHTKQIVTPVGPLLQEVLDIHLM